MVTDPTHVHWHAHGGVKHAHGHDHSRRLEPGTDPRPWRYAGDNEFLAVSSSGRDHHEHSHLEEPQ